MLTGLKVRNFKLFEEIDIELDQHVVFVGPNNSGKTTALQALTLWELGKNKWLEKRGGADVPPKRPGVTIGRRDLLALPVPSANLLWRNLSTRNVRRDNGEQRTDNVLIEIVVEGNSFVSHGNQGNKIAEEKMLIGNDLIAGNPGEENSSSSRSILNEGYEDWGCGLEFYYSNEESFYCRPLGWKTDSPSQVPEAATGVRFAYLPPMSGLAANETRLGSGAINVRIGQGRTAEVLRNLCYQLWETSNRENRLWEQFCDRIEELFGCRINEPKLSAETDEITMNYTLSDKQGKRHTFDISACGRGQQQIMLLLSYLANNPGCVLLMDEPDAHLEVLRQRQTYQILRQAVAESNSQLIVASHSEIVLNEAKRGSDVLVAFTGRYPHVVEKTSEVMKSLKDIGFEHYQQAEQRGWVLYLEGSTDLAILQAFSELLDHDANKFLAGPYVHYVLNQPTSALKHFHGVRDAYPNLTGIAIYDRLDFSEDPYLRQLCWEKREIENYICDKEALVQFAQNEALSQAVERSAGSSNLIDERQSLFVEAYRNSMLESINEIEDALNRLRGLSPWDADTKVSDEFLEPLFKDFYAKIGSLNRMPKKNYYKLIQFLDPLSVDAEVVEKLDAIVETAEAVRS